VSKRSYPRIGNITAIPKHHTKKVGKCKVCGERPDFRIDIQNNYMRGDDDVVKVCAAHKDDVVRGVQEVKLIESKAD
jgi:hypothetical protein